VLKTLNLYGALDESSKSRLTIKLTFFTGDYLNVLAIHQIPSDLIRTTAN